MKNREESFIPDMSEKELKVFIRKLWLKALALFGLELLGGILPFRGMMKAAYVIVPYCGELISVLALLWACFHFSAERSPLRKREYDRSARRLVSDTLILCVIAFISIAVSVVYAILNGFENDLLFFVLYVLGKVLVIRIAYSIHKMTAGSDFKVSTGTE